MVKTDPKAPVTNETFFGTVEHLVDRLDEVMDKKLGGLRDEMNKRFDRVEAKQVDHDHKIDDLRADLSDAPTRKEVNKLLRRVD